MTKRELYQWILKKGCKQIPLPDSTTMKAIYFENPRTGGYAILNTPVDDRKMFPATVLAICLSLNIEIPPNVGES